MVLSCASRSGSMRPSRHREVRSIEADIVVSDDGRGQNWRRSGRAARLRLRVRARAFGSGLGRLAGRGGGVVFRRSHLPRLACLLGGCSRGNDEKRHERADAQGVPEAVQSLRLQLFMLRSEPNLRDVARGICRNKGGSEARPKPEVAETSRAEIRGLPPSAHRKGCAPGLPAAVVKAQRFPSFERKPVKTVGRYGFGR